MLGLGPNASSMGTSLQQGPARTYTLCVAAVVLGFDLATSTMTSFYHSAASYRGQLYYSGVYILHYAI